MQKFGCRRIIYLGMEKKIQYETQFPTKNGERVFILQNILKVPLEIGLEFVGRIEKSCLM